MCFIQAGLKEEQRKKTEGIIMIKGKKILVYRVYVQQKCRPIFTIKTFHRSNSSLLESVVQETLLFFKTKNTLMNNF